MSGSLQETFDKDRRLAILNLLAEQHRYSLSVGLLTKALNVIRHRVYRDVVEADVMLLEQHRLVTREVLSDGPDGVTDVTLTKLGLDVTQGRPHPVVGRPLPKD